VNTSTSALAQGVVAQLPRADQLSDPEIRPLLHLPRSTLVGLARVIANRSTIPADAAETPSTNWSVRHLVRYIAGRPLHEIETLTPPPALKKSARRKSKLEDELEIALQPIEQELAKIAEEKEETRVCAVPLCPKMYSLTAAAPPGWLWCDVCYRKAVCHQHVPLWRERFVDMHCQGCDIKPTWSELETSENEWIQKKNDVIGDFEHRRTQEATAYERELARQTKRISKRKPLRKAYWVQGMQRTSRTLSICFCVFEVSRTPPSRP